MIKIIIIITAQNMVSGASINIHDPIKPFPGGKKKKVSDFISVLT